MQFRLLYKGKLPSQSQRGIGKQKHKIRKELHKQLLYLWKTHPFLTDYYLGFPPPSLVSKTLVSAPAPGEPQRSWVDTAADLYANCGYRFMPLVGQTFRDDIACALDILVLRRDHPGGSVKSGAGGGDIDNRIKVLLDALRMPQRCDELSGESPGPGEDPFFCLLEDDGLITELRITSDHLLTPLEPKEHQNDVHLVIHVKTIVTRGDPLTSFLT